MAKTAKPPAPPRPRSNRPLKKKTSYSLSPECIQLLQDLAADLGTLSASGTIELLVREKAEARGLRPGLAEQRRQSQPGLKTP